MGRFTDALHAARRATPSAHTDIRHEGPGDRAFQGADPRGRPAVIAKAVDAELNTPWRVASRYHRRAEVVDTVALTETGTVRLRLRVVDGEPFSFEPGQFVGVEADVAGVGLRRSPYCILSPPSDEAVFELLVRVVADGPLSGHLGRLGPGDVVAFRGPTGRSMIPKDLDRDLVLVATGVGIAPYYSLARYLLEAGFDRPLRVFWGLRLADDVWLLDELDALARHHANFSYRISLSRPPADWSGLRGRVTESMPPLLATLGATQFHLCGNGAMIEELAMALSDMGVSDEYIYKEPYFNARRHPDPAVLDQIRSRFVARDLFSPFAHQQRELFHLERPLGNADPAAGSDVVRRIPASVLALAGEG